MILHRRGFLAGVGAAVATSAAATPKALLDQAGWTRALQAALKANHTPGAALGLFVDGQTLVAVAGEAVVGGPSVRPQTVFRLGSMTKNFTTSLLMQQVEVGRIDLDRPVKSMLPEFVLGDKAATETMTPRLLLCHRSGFYGDVYDGEAGPDALRHYAEAGAQLEQVTPPDQAFSYSNAALCLAARLTEHVAGERWDRMFVERLVRPSGMARAGVLFDDLTGPDIAAGHSLDATGRQVPVPPEGANNALAAAGAMPWATVGDVLIHGRMLMNEGRAPNGARLLSPNSVRTMRHVRTVGPTPTFASGWGLGTQTFNAAGDLFGHDGVVAGQNSFLRVSPAHGLVFALMVNGGDARGVMADLFAHLENLLGVTLAERLPTWPEAPVAFDPAPLVGTYGVHRYRIAITAGDKVLNALPAGDAGPTPQSVEMWRQPDDPTGELFLTRIGGVRFPTQQRFSRGPDGKRYLLFRGRLYPKLDV
jgi:CubicO group peptidase (beta-lactamase class C family)